MAVFLSLKTLPHTVLERVGTIDALLTGGRPKIRIDAVNAVATADKHGEDDERSISPPRPESHGWWLNFEVFMVLHSPSLQRYCFARFAQYYE